MDNRFGQKNAVIADIVRKNEALEVEIARRMAIESALGDQLLQRDVKISELSSFVMLLVQRVGGDGAGGARVELTMDELRAIPEATRLRIEPGGGDRDAPYVLTTIAPVDGKTAGEAAREEDAGGEGPRPA